MWEVTLQPSEVAASVDAQEVWLGGYTNVHRNIEVTAEVEKSMSSMRTKENLKSEKDDP